MTAQEAFDAASKGGFKDLEAVLAMARCTDPDPRVRQRQGATNTSRHGRI